MAKIETANKDSPHGREYAPRIGTRIDRGEHKFKTKSHKCSVCGRCFALRPSLQTHLLKHVPAVPYDCTVCGRVFGRNSDFKDHMKSHEDEITLRNFQFENAYVKIHENESPVSGFQLENACMKSLENSGPGSSLQSENDPVKGSDSYRANVRPRILKQEEGLPPLQVANTGLIISEQEKSQDIKSLLKGTENSFVKVSLPNLEGNEVDSSIMSICIDGKHGSPAKTLSVEEHPKKFHMSAVDTKRHLRCPTCKDPFPSKDSLQRHADTLVHQCETCEKFYSSCRNLKWHRKCHLLSIVCKVCNKKFSSKQNLRCHELIHADEQICSFCGIKCINKRALREHTNKMHRESQEVSCKECGQKVKRCDLKVHKLIHKGNKIHQCEECGVSFAELYRLKNHICFHKQNKKKWKCMICNRILSTKGALEYHSLTHTGEQECNICGVKLQNAVCLKNHILSVHKGECADKKDKKKAQCDICGKMYFKFYINTHLRIHAGQRDFSCSECGKNFVSRTNLKEHQMIHVKGRKYCCSSCDKVFSSRKALSIHNRKHTGETPYKCSVCSRVFCTAWTLKNHLRLHGLEEAFTCDLCGKKFSQKKSLFAHYARDDHTKEELKQLDPEILNYINTKYQCPICGKKFFDKTMMTFHMRIHTGEKPYKCAECGKAFRIKSALKVHMKFHSGDLSYECAICQKPFPHQSLAQRHELLHNREKPHLCTICGKAFFTKNNLKLHIQRHALKTVYSCSNCRQEFTVKRKYTVHQKSCMYGTIASTQMSESGSLDSSSAQDYFSATSNTNVQESYHKKELEALEKTGFVEGAQSIECSEYLFDFDVESSQTQVTFSLSEDVGCMKEELVVLEIDQLEFRDKESL